mgnify:CR=1 FL=1
MKMQVPFYYEKSGRIEVEANSIKEAQEKAQAILDKMSWKDCGRLAECVDDSAVIDLEGIVFDESGNAISEDLEEKPRNTMIKYLYRDGANYKKNNQFVLDGVLTDKQIQEILGCLDEGMYFIPAQVGLPEKRFDKFSDDIDHVWFEMDEDSFQIVEEKPDKKNITPEELVKKFKEAARHWDVINYYLLLSANGV